MDKIEKEKVIKKIPAKAYKILIGKENQKENKVKRRNILFNSEKEEEINELELLKKHVKGIKKNIICSDDVLTFRKIMSSGSNRKYFKKFCQTEMNVENVSFWEQVQYKYKKLKNKQQRLILAETLFSTYIEPKSLFALNINLKFINEIKSRIEKSKIDSEDKLIDLFNGLQNEIENVMIDAFSRFKFSDEYKEMIFSEKERQVKVQEEIKIIKRDSCSF